MNDGGEHVAAPRDGFAQTHQRVAFALRADLCIKLFDLPVEQSVGRHLFAELIAVEVDDADLAVGVALHEVHAQAAQIPNRTRVFVERGIVLDAVAVQPLGEVLSISVIVGGFDIGLTDGGGGGDVKNPTVRFEDIGQEVLVVGRFDDSDMG